MLVAIVPSPGRSVNNKDDYLDCLKAEIGREHGCPAYYIRTEIVHEEKECKKK